MRVKFEDVVKRANTKEDRFNTDKIHYVGGEHIITDELMVQGRGLIKGSVIGPMFYHGFKAGQVLFVTRNPHLRKAAMVDFDGICSEKTLVLETKDKSVLLQCYLPLVMQSDDFWNFMEENKSGGVNYFVNWSTLATYEFSLPPLSEQRELADKLWAAYRLKESYRKLLNATDDMVKAKFIKMFGNEQQIGNISSECDTFMDGDWIESKDQSDKGIRLIQTGNVGDGYFINKEDKSRYISEETFNRLHCTEIYAGDILVSRLPDPVGRACIIPQGLGKSITAVDCTIIRLKDDVLPEYFITYTSSPLYKKQIKKMLSGSTRLRVSRANLGKVTIPIPNLKEQEKFVNIYTTAEATKSSLRRSIASIDKVIKSLING